jgi:hypothetical protein
MMMGETPSSKSDTWAIGLIGWGLIHLENNPPCLQWDDPQVYPVGGNYPYLGHNTRQPIAAAVGVLYSNELIRVIRQCMKYDENQRRSCTWLHTEATNALNAFNGLQNAAPNNVPALLQQHVLDTQLWPDYNPNPVE